MPTYLGALLFGFPVWLFLFWKRPDLRHKMLIMSIAVTFIAPVDTFFIPTYWNPITWGKLFGLPIDIFTILFGFTLGGIASVIYEETLGKHTFRKKAPPHSAMIVAILGCLVVFLFQKFTHLNFMYGVLVGTISMIAVVLVNRKDLFIDALLSGFFFAIVYTILLSLYILLFPYVLDAWNLVEFPQYIVGNVPHFEIIWAFVTGMFLGPFYEYSHRLIIK